MKTRNDKVIVQEVGLRDGLQSIPDIMSTKDKIRWIDAAYAAGIRYMELASFVPTRLLPQMADAAEVIAYGLTYPDVTITALVPNLKGAERAMECGVHRIVAPISVSHAHSLANVRKTPSEMVEEFGRIRKLCDSSGKAPCVQLIAGLSTVFGCTLQGHVPMADVKKMVAQVLDAGADLVAFGDTTGDATPGQVESMLDEMKVQAEKNLFIAHFHDTRGMALPNTLVALRYGVKAFDASLAGLGGCPHAPGATGNCATEDLVFMLESLGYDTGIDVEKLLNVRSVIQAALPNQQLFGSLARAGLPKDYLKTLADIGKATV